MIGEIPKRPTAVSFNPKERQLKRLSCQNKQTVMILVVGEILFDLFPQGRRLGGAPFNFAFHLKKLGFDVRFMSRVGNDDLGQRILAFLDDNQFNLDDIQVDPELPTGTVTVTLHPDGSHRFSIVQNTAYDNLTWSRRIETLAKSPWQVFYTGTLIQRNRNNEDLVQKIVSHKPKDAFCFCDINLRPGCYSERTILSSLDQADILKINLEELDEIAAPGPDTISEEKRVRQLMTRHGLDQVILTKGGLGALWFTDQTVFKSPVPQKTKPLKDTVGAGDAFAAMAVAGLLKGHDINQTLLLAHDFAGKICEISGAIPGNPNLYAPFKRSLEK